MRQRLATIDSHRKRYPAGQLPKETTSLEAKNATPNPIQRYGNDRRLQVFHDLFETSPERKQVTNPRDLAFSKNTHQFAIFDGFAGRTQGLEHLPWTQLRGDRDGLHQSRKGFDPTLLVYPLIHQ